MEAISAIGVFNALVFLLLFRKKENLSISDRILKVWLGVFALTFAIPILQLYGIFFQDTTWALVLVILMLSHFPFLYIYTRSLAENDFCMDWRAASNFFVVLLYAAAISKYAFLPADVRHEIAYGKEGIPQEAILPLIVFVGSLAFFLVRTLRILRKHQRNIRELFSFDSRINLEWIRQLILYFCVLLLISIIAVLLFALKVIRGLYTDYIVFLGFVLLFLCVSIKGYRQVNVFALLNVGDPEAAGGPSMKTAELPEAGGEEAIGEPVIPDSGPDRKADEEIHPQISLLQEVMVMERPFLEADLNVATLANRVSMHAHQLSRLINTELGQNFFDFVNGYRVEEFKRMVADPKNRHFSILSLALDAGFNSKATFNRIFKNKTGQTPSQFRGNFNYH